MSIPNEIKVGVLFFLVLSVLLLATIYLIKIPSDIEKAKEHRLQRIEADIQFLMRKDPTEQQTNNTNGDK